MDKKHKGALNECVAIVWLLNQGYEVFRNISQFGAADLVATNDNETLQIDVKSAQVYKDKWSAYKLTAEQKERDVKILLVLGDECRWQ